MEYSKRSLQKMLEDKNITTTAKSIAALLLIALDNGVVTREEILNKEEEEPKPRGRPRKYPPKEVDPNKVIDPKYHRLRTIRTNPTIVRLTNVETGETTTYGSLYKASKETKHGFGYFNRNNGKVVDGLKIEIN